MRILLSGGGTLGPVTPLLAMVESIREKYPDAEFLWVGTARGPERQLVEQYGITFYAHASGKLRRYLSIWNLTDLFKIGWGLLQSIRLLWRTQPDLCISAGGFPSVPVHWAAWFFGIPTWIHQQDVTVGLANRLMAPMAKKITTALDDQQKQFPKKKVQWLGNPIRKELFTGSPERARERFNLRSDLPVVFATGGGTGSARVNQMIVEAVQHLAGHAQVIHLTGKDRPQELSKRAEKHVPGYQVHTFFAEEMKDAYAVADIVISRGGFGTLTELAALQKCAVLIPKPGHQEDNVAFLENQGGVLVVNEITSDGLYLAKQIRQLLENPTQRQAYADTLHRLLPYAKPHDIIGIVSQLL